MALSEPAEFGHPDFILLDDITEEAFLENLKLRYEKGKVGQVYTALMSVHYTDGSYTHCMQHEYILKQHYKDVNW